LLKLVAVVLKEPVGDPLRLFWGLQDAEEDDRAYLADV
jgi:hypothetical protein